MIGGFRFEHGGKTYTCLVEERKAEKPEAWWWFTVSGDGHRYAPFQALARDTRDSVRARIVAYYDNHLVHRAMPASGQEHWARRGKAAAKGQK